jgi:tetratricopeptide (TPR) repeat protein
MRAGLPAPGQEAEFSRLLADALTNLAFRLIDARRVDDAVAPAEEASRAYRHAASIPGANVLAIVDMLWSLASNLATRPHAAVAPSRVAVDVLRGTAHLMKLAVAWHNFVLRLIEAQRIDEAMAPAQQAVRVYRQAAAIAGANLFEIVDMLASLSAFLLNVAIRPAEAVLPAQAAAEILRAATPPGGGDMAFRAKSAQAWHLYAVRLIGANRTGEALPPARQSLELYRRLAAEDPAFQDELAIVEQLVASLL